MSLDSFDIEDSPDGSAPEAASEQHEKQRDKSSKAMAGIARSRKDEGKGKKAADILFTFLVELLKFPDYDVFINPIFDALKLNIPSVYLVGILTLISRKASNTIRSQYGGKDMPLITAEPPSESTKIAFQNKTLRQDIRTRINEWIEDMFLATTKDPSSILTIKFLQLLDRKNEREVFVICIQTAISFFFFSKNIVISEGESHAFATFILLELEKKIRSLSLEAI